MNEAMKEIKENLKLFPQIHYEEKDKSIKVEAQGQEGFVVQIEENEDEITVFYEGWHEHFPKEQKEAIVCCFMTGLSEICRLKVFNKAGKDYGWNVELKQNNKWVHAGMLTTFSLKFWRKSSIRYLQNTFLKASELEKLFPPNIFTVHFGTDQSLICSSCQTPVEKCNFHLDQGIVTCGNCQQKIPSESIINNDSVNYWYKIIPPLKRDSFLLQLGFKKKPSQQTSKITLSIGMGLGLLLILIPFISSSSCSCGQT
jgi:hypothetical protein